MLLQINIDKDPAKAGVNADDADQLLAEVSKLPALRPRGLMTILSQQADPVASYQSMAQLSARLAEQLGDNQQQDWGALSMGMSADMDAAILAGATHIRIGTALFGARDA